VDIGGEKADSREDAWIKRGLEDDYKLNSVIDDIRGAVGLHGKPVGRQKIYGRSGTVMRRGDTKE